MWKSGTNIQKYATKRKIAPTAMNGSDSIVPIASNGYSICLFVIYFAP